MMSFTAIVIALITELIGASILRVFRLLARLLLTGILPAQTVLLLIAYFLSTLMELASLVTQRGGVLLRGRKGLALVPS